MWSIPPLSLSNRCVFRVITSLLIYQLLPSLPCNHGSKIDTVRLLGPRRATLFGRHTSKNGRQVAAATPYRSLLLMTNLSGTHLASFISILSHRPAHALPDQELFVACSSGADPQGRKVVASTSLVIPGSLRMMDGPQHAVHRQHHQGFRLLRSHRGSPLLAQVRHRVGPFAHV